MYVYTTYTPYLRVDRATRLWASLKVTSGMQLSTRLHAQNITSLTQSRDRIEEIIFAVDGDEYV